MPVALVRLARSLPLLIGMLVLAAAIYVVVAWRTSPNRAKAILIRWFLVISIAVCVFFAFAALYAAIDSNPTAVELALTFAVPGVIGLVVTLICRAVFLKNHPSYKLKVVKSTYVNDPLPQRILRWLFARM